MRYRLTAHRIINGRPGPAYKTAVYSSYAVAVTVRGLIYADAAQNGRRVFVGIEPKGENGKRR